MNQAQEQGQEIGATSQARFNDLQLRANATLSDLQDASVGVR